MEHNTLLTTLALVHSRFFGTEVGNKAQAFFSALYNDGVPADSAFAGRLFTAFSGTPAFDLLTDEIRAIFLRAEEPEQVDLERGFRSEGYDEFLSERDVSDIKRLSRALFNRFTWDATPQGWDYWNQVMMNLGGILGKTGWAHDVDTEYDREVSLRGLIGGSFTWGATRQGIDYWDGVHQALLALEQPVEPEAEAQYDDGSSDPEYTLESGFSDRAFDPTLLASLARGILIGFRWHETPQGDDYWDEVFLGLEKLSGYVRGEFPTGRLSVLLDEAVYWDSTPQGHEYWSAVHKNLERLEEAGVVKNPTASAPAPEPEPYTLSESERADAVELARRISEDITWHTSPEGEEFWGNAFDNLLEIAGAPRSAGWQDSTGEGAENKSDLLDFGFHWGSTPQGASYWSEVYEALYALELAESEDEGEDEGDEDEPGESASGLHPSLNPDMERRIAGVSARLIRSFIFLGSSQGVEYWRGVMTNLARLVGKDGEYEWAHVWETVTPTEPPSDLLYAAFSWTTSPQGFEYWETVYENLLGLERDGTIRGGFKD